MKYRKLYQFLYLPVFMLLVLFVAGCQSKRARLLKETSWYTASEKWYSLDDIASRLGKSGTNNSSIWMGKVVRTEHSKPDRNISEVYLEKAERLKPYSMFSNEIRLFTSKEVFKACQPKVGEYWAFRVNRNLKGMMEIVKAVKLIYNLDTGKLYIVDPLASCDISIRRINNSDKGYVVVLNGLQITKENQNIIPAKLKTGIKKKMTPREIVNMIGKGWLHSFSSAGIITWTFSDGTVISIMYPESLDKKVNVMIRKTYSVDEVNIIMLKTMQQISSDFRKIKTKYPQLENIDSAKIEFNSFYYSKGWVKDSKKQGVIFKKNGCDISLRVRYPASTREINQLVGSPKNGKNIQFWRSVRAENTEQGKMFKKEANKIISKNILKMLEALGHKSNAPNTYKYK